MNKIFELVTIRNVRESDKNFILATLLRGLYYGDSWFSLIPKDIFMNEYKKVAHVFVNSDKFTVKVACLKEDEDVILGYSILTSDSRSIVWVYVKEAWRKKGLGRMLVPADPISVMHLTNLGKRLLATKFLNTIFNPFYTGV